MKKDKDTLCAVYAAIHELKETLHQENYRGNVQKERLATVFGHLESAIASLSSEGEGSNG